LHPWVIYLIIPIFAFANAGLTLPASVSFLWTERISLGVFLGLLLGKQLGIIAATWLAVKSRLADLPKAVSWKQIYGVGWLAGIGFTMSLFISSLAFEDQSQQEAAKFAILLASLISALVGYLLLRRLNRSRGIS
jgi:NhaA family Na+:H+ antiporter